MRRITHTTPATPEQVWSVLADGWLYASWVVGASRIRDVDAHWPAPGSRIHHSVGLWPLVIDDITESLPAPDNALVLSARAWPAGKARVSVTVEPAAEGSRLAMDEYAETAPVSWIPYPVQFTAVAPRLRECLVRLALLAQRRPDRGGPA
ncbi:SRPBCC family protein [Williamsia sterculiae]|uniref:Polyketide cyclase / dehydrase and lipid transport n=1 Tax=Williamsia sterculiae TaxID=1344003 RepID=A0A1N7H5I0_9NOCA|nr:SRPBCC family protein [Williamsia sterculiae]SIS20106.1 Polyketide cyclase / dehydrase and lipid transport [Williamsia sterculiae]